MWTCAWLIAAALAQDIAPDPEVVPSAGLATEDGAGALWVNPANLGFDRDVRWGVYFRGAPEDGYTRWSGAVSGGFRGLAGGFRWLLHEDGRRDFALNVGGGFQLPRRVTVGASLQWNFEDQRRNYVAFDLSAAWRPLPWIGMTVLTRNLGNAGDSPVARPLVAAGLAIRPAGKVLVVGTDFVYTFGGPDPRYLVDLVARVRPTSGLFLRAHIDTQLSFGAGLELYFGGAGVGLHAETTDFEGVPDFVGWVASEARDENLARGRRQVTRLDLRDRPAYQPPQLPLRASEPSWLETMQHFQRAYDDPRLRGMVLNLGNADLSWAQWREVRSWITKLRTRDKEVTAYLEGSPSNGALYASSAASRVLLHPASTADLTGLGVELLHLRGLLDAVGVEVQVVRRGEYKSAAESWVTLEPSEANRRQQLALLGRLEDELVTALAEGRRRTPSDVRAWLDGGPWTAEEAERIGLVDARAYPDQIRAELRDLHGINPRVIDLSKVPRDQSPWDSPAEIGVVYVEGPMVAGTSSDPGLLTGRTTGAITIARQLERMARDVKVRAVVLRVDSPGGSAYAADAIWRSVERVQAAGKPVVVSMGGVAASGGYYVAAGADAIWAEPGTITGSIGVIALKPSVGPLLNTLGVGVTQLGSGPNVGLNSPYRRWDPAQVARMDAIVDDTYDRFKDRVVQGRGLSPEAVEALAQGRVWSGLDAADKGLVDHLGGLTDALDHARELAGIRPQQPVTWVDTRERVGLLRALLAPPVRLTAPGTPGAALFGERGLFRPLTSLWTLAAHADEQIWLIDPWWTDVGPR